MGGAADVVETLGTPTMVESLEPVVECGEEYCAAFAVYRHATDVGPDFLRPAVLAAYRVTAEHAGFSSADHDRAMRSEVQMSERSNGCEFADGLLFVVEDNVVPVCETDCDCVSERRGGDIQDLVVAIDGPPHFPISGNPASASVAELDDATDGSVSPGDRGPGLHREWVCTQDAIATKKVQSSIFSHHGDITRFKVDVDACWRGACSVGPAGNGVTLASAVLAPVCRGGAH